MWTYNTTPSSELYHYGVKGMKWGVRKNDYRSTSARSAIARYQNNKIDKSFKEWNDKAAKRSNAIDLGKKANESKRAYENNKSDNNLRKAYRLDKRNYKKAYRQNTSYHKGQIRSEVGKDLSRKYLSDAKKIKKGLDKNPNDRNLKKQYTDLMNKHDVERMKARRATEVGAKRSSVKAGAKRKFTMSVKSVATTAAIGLGILAISKLSGSNININSEQVMDWTKKGKKVVSMLY